MDMITSKATIKEIVATAVQLYHTKSTDSFIGYLHNYILRKKVRFPLLELAAKELHKSIPDTEHVQILDSIVRLREIGGNVIVGMLLQLRQQQYFNESVDKAVEYIIIGDEWYVCDIIGERVFGHALLSMPDQMLPVLMRFTEHDAKWIVRSVGVAAHYAIKKGLQKTYVDYVFKLLLSLRSASEFHTKKGIGWAAKTTAKFHPDVIEKYESLIQSDDTGQWFKTKIKTGLGRTAKYAHRYTS